MPTIYRHTIEMGLGVIQRCSLGQYEPLGQSQFLKTINKIFDFEEVCNSWLDRFFGKFFFIYTFYNFILAGTHDFVKFTHYLYVGTFIKNVSTFIKLSKILTVNNVLRKTESSIFMPLVPPLDQPKAKKWVLRFSSFMTPRNRLMVKN